MLNYYEYWDVLNANPVVQTEENIVQVQQMQTIELIVEVLEIKHATAPQRSRGDPAGDKSPTVVLEVDE